MAVLTRMAPTPLQSHKLIALIGPTASGKSTLAMELAERIGGEILSADSMAVYRGMDIGTAKPTPEQRRRVNHHGIDLVDPDQTFTVARFVELADQIISDSKTCNLPLIITGGTPLYFRSLFEGLFQGPPADPQLRARLNQLDSLQLHQRLRTVDPAASARIHINDRKRLIRALEVFELTGRPISQSQIEWTSQWSRHPALWFGLHWDKQQLNRRINSRVKTMLQSGWIEETRGLLDRYGTLSATASQATGYKQIILYLQGRCTLEKTIENIKIATRQLARKQIKWFRRFPNVIWLPGDESLPNLVRAILARLDEHGFHESS